MSNFPSIHVRQAAVSDLAALVPLFDGYRQFYGKPSDIGLAHSFFIGLAHSFLLERFQHHQSVIFIAMQPDGTAVGFTQLYPMFSSVSAARTFILNDLFVVQEARRKGVGIELLKAATQFGRSVGAIRLSLSTAIDNQTAQALYESLGWVRDTEFYAYSLSL